jgi:hypothetical protein
MGILNALARVLTVPLPPAAELPPPRKLVSAAAEVAKREAASLVKGFTESPGHPVERIVRNLRLVASQNGHGANGKAVL